VTSQPEACPEEVLDSVEADQRTAIERGAQVRGHRRMVDIMRGKGAKRRVIWLPDDALADVLRWTDRRPRATTLICTLQGEPVSRHQYVQALLARLAKRGGVERRVNPHALRHTYATELAAEGKALPVIQGALGHSSPVATAIYLHALHPADLERPLRDRPPLLD
jgi:site-specific recombinase XerD